LHDPPESAARVGDHVEICPDAEAGIPPGVVMVAATFSFPFESAQTSSTIATESAGTVDDNVHETETGAALPTDQTAPGPGCVTVTRGADALTSTANESPEAETGEEPASVTVATACTEAPAAFTSAVMAAVSTEASVRVAVAWPLLSEAVAPFLKTVTDACPGADRTSWRFQIAVDGDGTPLNDQLKGTLASVADKDELAPLGATSATKTGADEGCTEAAGEDDAASDGTAAAAAVGVMLGEPVPETAGEGEFVGGCAKPPGVVGVVLGDGVVGGGGDADEEGSKAGGGVRLPLLVVEVVGVSELVGVDVELAVLLPGRDAVDELEGDAPFESEAVALSDAVELHDRVRVEDGLAPTDKLAVAESDAVEDRESVAEAEGVTLTERLGVAERVAVELSDSEAVGDGEVPFESEGVGLRDIDDVVDRELEADGEAPVDSEGVADFDILDESDRVGVAVPTATEAVTAGDADAFGAAVEFAVEIGEAVAFAVGVGVAVAPQEPDKAHAVQFAGSVAPRKSVEVP
jgi:hypothetical protein